MLLMHVQKINHTINNSVAASVGAPQLNTQLHPNFVNSQIEIPVCKFPYRSDMVTVLVIPDGQNFGQKLPALAITKIPISLDEMKALGELYRMITIGRCKLQCCGSN